MPASAVTTHRVQTRLSELEQAVQSLSARVNQLGREARIPTDRAEGRRPWRLWLRTWIGGRRRASSAPRLVRENRRMDRHAAGKTEQQSLRV